MLVYGTLVWAFASKVWARKGLGALAAYSDPARLPVVQTREPDEDMLIRVGWESETTVYQGTVRPLLSDGVGVLIEAWRSQGPPRGTKLMPVGTVQKRCS